MSRASTDQSRSALLARLYARRPEIGEAILTRVHAVPTASAQDADYLEGLRAAVIAAVDHCLTGIELGEDRVGLPPAQVLVQARHAARNRIGLDVVLRRYAAGYSVLSDFLAQETDRVDSPLPTLERSRLQRRLTALFDRLVEGGQHRVPRRGRAGSEAARAAPSRARRPPPSRRVRRHCLHRLRLRRSPPRDHRRRPRL
jgi:hypothetical protein